MIGHFVLLTKETTLMSKITSKHRELLHYHEKCDSFFATKEKYEKHKLKCTGDRCYQEIEMPKIENGVIPKVTFIKAASKQLKCPVVVYSHI